METLRHRLRRVWNFVKTFGMEVAYEAHDQQLLVHFENVIAPNVRQLQKVDEDYEHCYTYRLHALNETLEILEDLQRVTFDYGRSFSIKAILKAWRRHCRTIIRTVFRIVGRHRITDDLTNNVPDDTKIKILSETVIRLLDVRYEMVYLTKLFLDFTDYCDVLKYDVEIFWEVCNAASFLDKSLAVELDRVMLNADIINFAVAKNLVIAVSSYHRVMKIHIHDQLVELGGILVSMYPNAAGSTRRRASISFETFEHILFDRI